ncbi:MAG: UDP-N-acetylmuramoyl-tripeptide--D-alanyl-D-alanine ligase [Clostridia bacterium]|nr:UDP-N-acetylmuramoyl-tripeptide--D-alanyl-D-alanine ligase [Clostridia bacterium]
MIDFTLKQIAEITGGEYYGPAEMLNTKINGITIDSRAVQPGCLFVPIVGERFDGHNFITSAVEKGAIASFTHNEGEWNCPVIRVGSTEEAFRAISGAYRARFDIPVIGVTGSVGKTTTKELIASVLSQRFDTLKNQGNLNNQTGVPLTLFRLTENHGAAVVEMGTNHFGEIGALADIVRPTIGVITNIGESHIEYLGSRDGILREKSDVFKNIGAEGRAIVNGDDDKLCTLRGKVNNLTTYGFGVENDIRAEDVMDKGLEGSEFTAVYGDKSLRLTVPAPGRHMIMNAMCAMAVGLALGMSQEEIAAGVAAYVPAAGRMDIIKGRSITLLSDAYNASPTSMKGSIDIACKAEGRSVLILGDMLELGDNAPEYHYQVGRHAAAAGADLLISIGELSREINRGAAEGGVETMHFANREELSKKLDYIILEGDTVLVKASHSMGLDNIAEYLKNNF